MTSPSSSSPLGTCVRAVWQRTQRKHLAAGFLAFLRWAVPLFLAGMTVDWLLDLPPFGRLALLLLITLFPLVRAWKTGWKHLRRFHATRTAVAIEEQEGGLESLLATAVEMDQNGPTPGTSESLWLATREKAEEAARSLNPARIVPFRPLRRPAVIVLALAAVLLAFHFFNGPFLQAGLGRLFNPWSPVAYPTDTTLDPGKGDLVVREGDRATLTIKISGEVPETATLFLRTGEGDPRELELEVIDDQAQYLLASASRDFSYRVEAGDARSDWYEVEVIPAPRVTGVSVDLEFPSYLGREPETIEALTLSVPESTRVAWQLTLDQPVRSAVLHRDGDEPLPLAVSDDGTRLAFDEEVAASRGYSFSWVEKEHGFAFTSPRYFLQVASDQPPQVELTTPESNLNALLGRPLALAVRARDDHGIGTTRLIHRVNLRPAKTITLDQTIRSGEGEQTLTWDYRTALPDLQVGDTVSFIVEVADRYPGPDGPHLARSETRRLSFLSREDYLARIQRQQDRLLTRVRSIYRQERAAHEFIRDLDPQDPGFAQTCQLEAIRQEMLREQLKETAREVQALLDDLAANQITEALEQESLARVQEGITAIAEKQIAPAASLLRDQAGSTSPDPSEAALVVNRAARQLADLVLLRGIDSAREVFARESRMLAREQATLRLLTLQADQTLSAGALATRQETLARWTRERLASLRQGMRYDKRPISVLQLTRRLKDLSDGGTLESLAATAALLRDAKTARAASRQTAIISSFLAAEFSMRTGAEYAALMDFREELTKIRAAHESLHARVKTLSPEDFAARHPDLASAQAALRDQFIPALLPPVPTPRPRLFDETLPQPPPVEATRQAAEQALNAALGHLTAGNQESALAQQAVATAQLAQLDQLLESSTVELGLRTSGLTTLVSGATERINLLEDFEARQIALLIKTEETALDEEPAQPLVEPQTFLNEEIALFARDLSEESKSNPDVLPLLSQLEELAYFLQEAQTKLKNNLAEDALGFQEQAADLLAKVLELAQGQAERLTLLQDLYAFQRAVIKASGWMSDIVAEQKDLIAATRKAKAETAPALLPVVKNLRQCLVDIAPALDLVAGRLDVGTPLLFAGTDLEDAVFGIEDGDFLDAEDAQLVAAESLDKVQSLVREIARQTGYTAEIVEFLHRQQAATTLLAFRQDQLRQKLAAAPDGIPANILAAQKKLLDEATASGALLQKVTGMPAYRLPSRDMARAHAALKSGDAPEAGLQMEEAQNKLAANAEDLFLIITMLHGLPSIEITSASEPALVLLTEVLALASKQRKLSRSTFTHIDPGQISSLAAAQTQLLVASSQTLTTTPVHPKLITINGEMARAVSALANADPATAHTHQSLADEALRHFIIEQALILETAREPGSSSDEPVLTENETDDLYESTANFVSDFVSGETPEDRRTEWEVLGNRNRAALNQNFARELPLEYRAILKNYYERVAK